MVHIAPDRKLKKKVMAFLRAEAMENSPAYGPLQEKLVRESGLLDESVETIFAMKALYAKYWEQKRKT